jgi:hypothetical protein
LLHLRARWYSPSEGVFLSRDPVESEPPYQYVRGNPVNHIDPSGYCGGLCGLIIELYEKARGRVRTLSGIDDQINQSSPPFNFSNAGEATLLSLMGEDKAYLGGNAILRIRLDPEMQAFERVILTDLRSDSRYRREAFYKFYQPLDDLGEVRSLTFGGFGHPDNMIYQFFHFWYPKYKPTWDAGKNDLTWLVRHASVKAIGNAYKNGDILIKYQLNDTLDLKVHKDEPWNSPYNLVVSPLGFGYHRILRGTAMEIEGYWSTRIRAMPSLNPCFLP